MPPGKRNRITCNYCPENKRRKQDFASTIKLQQHLKACKSNITRNKSSENQGEQVRNINASNLYSESSAPVNTGNSTIIEAMTFTSIVSTENTANEFLNNQASDLMEATWDANSDIDYYSNPTSPIEEPSASDDGHKKLIKYGEYQVAHVPFICQQNLM